MVFRETDPRTGQTVQITPVAVTVTKPKTTTPTTTTTTTTRTSTGGRVPITVKESAPAPKPVVTETYVEPTASGMPLSEFKQKLGVSLTPLEKQIVDIKTQQQAQAELQAIPPTPYYETYGYRPESPAYIQAISEITQSMSDIEATKNLISNAPSGTIFYIGSSPIPTGVQDLLGKSMLGRQTILKTTPRYTQEQAQQYYTGQIKELTESKQLIEEYQRKGYGLDITEKGYNIFLPKASEVVRDIYGREPTDVYIAKEIAGGYGFGMLGAIAGGMGAMEQRYEETAQAILGTTRRPGESLEAYTGRFALSPEAITNIWLPAITLGGSKLVTTAGKALAPQIGWVGEQLGIIGGKLAPIGGKLTSVVEKVPEYARFRIGFAGETAKYVGGRTLSLASSPIGSNVLKYGFYAGVEAPELIETARTRPEMLLSRIGSTLPGYEVGMAQLDVGADILGKGIRQIRQPGFSDLTIMQRAGLRPLDDFATQPVVGLRMKGRLSEMTASDIEKADIKLAEGYKQPKTVVTAEERELESLARSLDKTKRPGFKDFLKSEEGTQPVPGLRFFGKKEPAKTLEDIWQSTGGKSSAFKIRAQEAGYSSSEITRFVESQSGLSSDILGVLSKKDYFKKDLIPTPVKVTTKGMTPDEALAFGYKEKPSAGLLASDERELAGLADTMRKKGKLQEFLFSTDEASASLTPRWKQKPTKGLSADESLAFTLKEKPVKGLAQDEKELIGLGESIKKKGKNIEELLFKTDEATQPAPGLRLLKKKEPAPPSREFIFAEETGKKTTIDIFEPFPGAKVVTETTPKTYGVKIQEYPRTTGTLEIGEITKTGKQLTIPSSYTKELTQVGTGGRQLDIIEAQLGKPTGKLVADESKKGTLTMAVFRPGEKQYFEGFMGVKRITPTSKYGMGTQEPSLFESGLMPETTESAKKIYEGMNKPFARTTRPVEGWGQTIKNVYKTEPTTSEVFALNIGGKTKVLTKDSALDIAGLKKTTEPIEKKGYYALDFKGEEKVFLKELEKKPYSFDVDIAKTGLGEQKAFSYQVKDQTKLFTREDLLGLGKGDLKGRPTVYKRDQLERALYGKPGGVAETIGEGKLSYAIEPKIKTAPGVRPKEGWGDYFKYVQTEDVDTLRYLEKLKRQQQKIGLPELEKDIVGGKPVVRKGTSPFRFEKTELKTVEDIKPITGKSGDESIVTLVKERPVKQPTKTFEPSGLYESPDLRYVTTSRPLSRQEMKILRESQGLSSQVSKNWEQVRPRLVKRTSIFAETTGILATGSKALTMGAMTTGLRPKTGEGLLSATLPIITTRPSGELGAETLGLGELGLTKTGMLSLDIEDFKPIQDTGEEQQQLIDQIQNQQQRQDQQQEQLTKKQLDEELVNKSVFVDIFRRGEKDRDIGGDRFFRGGRGGETKIKIPRIPRKKPDEEQLERIPSRTSDKNSYHVEVKERGMYGGEVKKGIKFKRVTSRPLTRENAMSLGAEITDKGSAVSFRLKKTKERPSQLSRPVKDYGSRSYKFTKKNDVFIEKPEYRMDTPGELQEVSALGQEARRSGMKLSRTLGHRSLISRKKESASELLFLKTPTNRSTRKLSRNIKETGLFKKNKGGKNNAYY